MNPTMFDALSEREEDDAMARNLVICTDGTWNTPDQSDRHRVVASNVVKVCRAVSGRNAKSGVEQLVYYDTGVGTGGRWDRIKGGVFGVGLFDNVQKAYKAIGSGWRPQDRLFLFGFSRGAFTARSLAGLIGVCGIPDPSKGPVAEALSSAVEVYRMDPRKQRTEREKEAAAHLARWSHHDDQGNPIRSVWFVGVWDTVGALGVPLKLLNWVGRHRYSFHDVRLGTHIQHAYHAIAIDERRRPFKPTLWLDRETNADQQVEQLWFPGVHSNIGGGYVDAGLSDRALLWMCAKARAAGLGLNNDYMRRRLNPDYHGELRDPLSLVYKMSRPFLRPIGKPWPDAGNSRSYPALKEGVHYSAERRHGHVTEALYQANPGAANLTEVLDSKQLPVAPALAEERDFHLSGAAFDWGGDGSAPAPL